MKTIVAQKLQIPEKWYIVDANNQTLGRLASRLAYVLRGKKEPYFAPDVDPCIHIVVINADKANLTGNKATEKTYYWHSGYVGGIKSIVYNKLIKKHPDQPIMKAVKGMLPKNRLGRKLLGHLRVYSSKENYTLEEHPHIAQQPQPLSM